MGIPRFARQMLAAFPGAFKSDQCSVTRGAAGPMRIFFDFNSTLHESARDVMRESSEAPREEDIIREAMHRLLLRAAALMGIELPPTVAADRNALFAPSVVPPNRRTTDGRSVVYVAIDGVPPRAKMQQQRYRRFAAAWLRANDPAAASLWDTNAITPGTAFMTALEVTLRMHLAQMEALLGARIVLSGPDEAGEGEQKIFQYLRARSAAAAQPPGAVTDDIVYGLDADLIMQAMQLHASADYCHAAHRLWVAREVQDDAQAGVHAKIQQQELMFIDVRALTDGIKRRHGCDVDDFTLLCVLLGNDFVPRLQCVSIADGGIDTLMRLRKQALQETHEARLVVGRSHDILLAPLLRVLELLAQAEDALMTQAEQRHRAACERASTRRDPGPDALPLVEPFPDVVLCRLPGWRPRYNFHVLSLLPQDAGARGASQEDACQSYFQGWIWSFRYNQQRCLNRHWHYAYPAAPTVTDLFNHVSFHHAGSMTTRDLERGLGDDEAREAAARLALGMPAAVPGDRVEQRLQLLMVLPPQSSHLLDATARRLMHEPRWGTCHMYPTGFALAKYLKYRAWECHPLLPHVDVHALVTGLRDAQDSEPASGRESLSLC